MSDYRQAPWFLRRVINPAVGFGVGPLGISLRGGMSLTVPGRTTGRPYSVPVYPLNVNSRRYLVAPRGQTDWVKNLRVAGAGTLSSGREQTRFVATEIDEAEKPPILRAYLDRWFMEAGAEFGVPRNVTIENVTTIDHRHPVFRIETG